MQLTEKL